MKTLKLGNKDWSARWQGMSIGRWFTSEKPDNCFRLKVTQDKYVYFSRITSWVVDYKDYIKEREINKFILVEGPKFDLSEKKVFLSKVRWNNICIGECFAPMEDYDKDRNFIRVKISKTEYIKVYSDGWTGKFNLSELIQKVESNSFKVYSSSIIC